MSSSAYSTLHFRLALFALGFLASFATTTVALDLRAGASKPQPVLRLLVTPKDAVIRRST